MSRTILDLLQERYPTAKKQTLRRMIQSQRVRLNGQPVRSARQAVGENDQLEVDDRPTRQRAAHPRTGSAAALPFRVIFEDADFIVIDKPQGLLTSTVAREPRATALSLLRAYLAQRQPKARVGVVHRLDKDASGLLVFSKNDAAFRSLKQQFFERSAQRTYLAMVGNIPTPRSGCIDTRLLEHADGSVHSTRNRAAGKRAVTEYETIAARKGAVLLCVKLRTGRKHQIRAHLAERAVPILGDRIYGDAASAPRLMLAATELTITHPRTGKRLSFKINPPTEMLWHVQ